MYCGYAWTLVCESILLHNSPTQDLQNFICRLLGSSPGPLGLVTITWTGIAVSRNRLKNKICWRGWVGKTSFHDWCCCCCEKEEVMMLQKKAPSGNPIIWSTDDQDQKNKLGWWKFWHLGEKKIFSTKTAVEQQLTVAVKHQSHQQKVVGGAA